MTPQNKETVEVTGRFYKRLYRNDDGSYCVNLYTDKKITFTAVGNNLPEVSFPVTFAGKWTTSQKYGRQFDVEMVVDQLPSAQRDVEQFIASLKLGIGVKRVGKMISLVGLDKFWDALDQDPLQFCSIKGIESGAVFKLKEAVSNLSAQQGFFQLLGGDLSCNAKQYKRICSFFGNNSEYMLNSIRENPFVLMKCGYTFEELDYFGSRHTDYPINDYRRLLAAGQQALMNAKRQSHVGLPEDIFIANISNLLSKQGFVSKEDIQSFLAGANQCQDLIYDMGLYYLPRSYQEETTLAKLLMELVEKPQEDVSRKDFDDCIAEYCEDKGFALSKDQKDAVWTALTRSLCVITGGPGTGKSTILDALLFCWNRFFDEDWRLMAPTGKAAVRMTETTQQPATTIHSSLGLIVGNEDPDIMDDRVTPSSASVIVADESSMVDQTVAVSLAISLQAKNFGKELQHLVLVGDPDQLPSVGWGNVLADLIESEVVPICRLSTVYRQGAGSPIITNSIKMQNGDTELDFSDPSFKRFHVGDDEANMEAACQFYLRCIKAYGIENVAMLSPYHKATAISTNALNKALQSLINPDHGQGQVKSMGQTLRQGDRVMMLKNTEFLSNGDIGTITYVDPNAGDTDPCVVVAFENGSSCEYIRDNLNQLELAYAISVHKSQGSQYDTVIMLLPNEHSSFLKRNILYTGITRSKKNVAIFSPTDTIRKCIANNKRDDRYTNLKFRLQKLAESKEERKAA